MINTSQCKRFENRKHEAQDKRDRGREPERDHEREKRDRDRICRQLDRSQTAVQESEKVQ